MTNLREVAAFLLGEGELDGVGFGDPHPTERGNYWWRKHLRAALAQPEPEELGEIVPANEEQLKRIAKLVEPEPVAQVDYNERGNIQWLFGKQIPDKTFLYTAPPQREWQTLTDEEMFSLWVRCPAETEDRFAFARAIEQALKEKNT